MAKSVEEARAALDEAEAKLAAATTVKEKIAASKEAAAARKELQAANAAARAEEATAREEAAAAARDKAEAERPKTGAEMAAELKGVRPIIGPGESPDVIGGAGFPGYVDYKPIDTEEARRAVYGYNRKTGKAYTPEEIKAANAGYLYGEDQGGAVGYELDPRTGQMNILYKSGMVSTSGATYKYTPEGYVVPSDAYMENVPGFAYDDFGRMINAQGQLVTQADIDKYNELVQTDPKKAKEFARGKGFNNTIVNSGAVINASANISRTDVNTIKNASGNFVPLTSTSNVSTGNNFVTPGGQNLTAEEYNKRTNAMSGLINLFSKYGLESLIPTIRTLAMEGAGEDTIALRLQDTPEYKLRFSANTDRIKKGLKVLDPGTYLALEDRYRQIIRAYGLKQFDNDNYVQQFIANDVSPEEVSSRVVNAVQRVQNADPAVSAMLRQYYNIGVTDMVAYVLDPVNQLPKIERQIGAAEIGVAAGRQGLTAGVNVAEQLAAQGVTQAEAQRGYSTIADILPQATKLSQIYTGVLDQYGQAEAEQEVFNSLASAQRKRRALAEREIATFAGASGLGRTALDQSTRGNF